MEHRLALLLDVLIRRFRESNHNRPISRNRFQPCIRMSMTSPEQAYHDTTLGDLINRELSAYSKPDFCVRSPSSSAFPLLSLPSPLYDTMSGPKDGQYYIQMARGEPYTFIGGAKSLKGGSLEPIVLVDPDDFQHVDDLVSPLVCVSCVDQTRSRMRCMFHVLLPYLPWRDATGCTDRAPCSGRSNDRPTDVTRWAYTETVSPGSEPARPVKRESWSCPTSVRARPLSGTSCPSPGNRAFTRQSAVRAVLLDEVLFFVL